MDVCTYRSKPFSAQALGALTFSGQAGLTLIEIMIGITIGSLLLSVLMVMYVTCQKSFMMQTALYEIQDSAKIAISTLTTAIHQSGNIGCAKLAPDFPITAYDGYSLTSYNKIYASHPNEIMLRYMDYPNAALQKTMTDSTTLIVDNKLHFTKGEILVIANCRRAEIVAVKEVRLSANTQYIITQKPLHHNYDQYAEVGPLVINRFYVAKTKRTNLDGSPVYALYFTDIKQHSSELVAGIKQIQFRYTIKREGKLLDVAADEVSDWSQVIGADLDLDVYSPPVQKTWHLFAMVQGGA